jgi:hypothetical protein
MEIDRVPISQLPSRYGIARSVALYTHLKDLKIFPEKTTFRTLAVYGGFWCFLVVVSCSTD